MNKKFWKSKELWLVSLGLVNYGLNYFSLPSFEPSPEFYAALLLVLGVLRVWFTEAKLSWK